MCTPYSNNAAGYNTTYPSAQLQQYQYTFKSTSSYTSMTSYQTVKPLDDNGFVSGEYTTYDVVYKPRNMRNGLDLDGDEPTGGMVPIGEPIVPLLILILAYLSYQEIKRRRERKHFFYTKK